MKRNIFTRLLCVALLACAPAGLVRCGGTATQMGTETGNPPVIDNQKLRLEWTPNGVQLIGDPGAITPGAEVRLTNTRTGESASATAAMDGSLSLAIAGNLSDPYEVRVSAAGRETTEPLSGAPDDLTTLSCTELENRLYQFIGDSFANADASCSTKDDCVGPGLVGCDQGQRCGFNVVLSRAGEAAARADAEQRTAAICAELDRCQRFAQSCVPPPDQVVSCLEGSCVQRPLEQLSCLELSSEASVRGGSAVESADKACSIDADCSLVFPSVRCAPPCRYAIAVANAAAAALPGAIAQQAESACQAFDQRACPEQLIPCPAPPLNPRAVCVNNRCDVELNRF